jgi:hypothetical protein
MRLRAALLAFGVALVAAAAAAGDVPHWNVWLCRPGLNVNYCNTDLSTTVFWPDGTNSTIKINDAKTPIDCFYVYPRPKRRPRRSRRPPASPRCAACSRRCIARRGMLEQLIKEQDASMRKLLVSALLLGGDVSVGGHERFAGVPACHSLSQTGCIVAYSSWNRTPPGDAGEQGVAKPGQHVLCVNPAAPAGGSGPVTPIFPWFLPEGILPGLLKPQPSTTWVALPELYTARCVRAGARSWLLITRIQHAGDPRPSAQPILSPSMGLHAADINIALGALITLVRSETAAYLAHH